MLFARVLLFGFAAFVLAAQLWLGFPPFYRRFGSIPEAELRRFVPQCLLLFPPVMAFVAFELPALLALTGMVALYLAWRIRKIVAATARSAPRLLPNWPIFALYPMLAFDLWSLGGAAALATL